MFICTNKHINLIFKDLTPVPWPELPTLGLQSWRDALAIALGRWHLEKMYNCLSPNACQVFRYSSTKNRTNKTATKNGWSLELAGLWPATKKVWLFRLKQKNLDKNNYQENYLVDFIKKALCHIQFSKLNIFRAAKITFDVQFHLAFIEVMPEDEKLWGSQW